MTRHRRNPYNGLPRDLRDRLRELVPGQRIHVPRYDPDELPRRDAEIQRKFNRMTKGLGQHVSDALQVLARSYCLSESRVRNIVYRETPKQGNDIDTP